MISDKIKMTRKNLNITLKELAKRTGLSTSYLSNLERGETSPTLDNLQVICNALEIDLIGLIQGAMQFYPVVKRQDRQPIYTGSYRTRYEMISDPNQNMRASALTISASYFGEEPSLGHSEDEFLMVIKGSVLMSVQDQDYLLSEGDTIYIKANNPHKYKKVSEDECILYCVKINKR